MKTIILLLPSNIDKLMNDSLQEKLKRVELPAPQLSVKDNYQSINRAKRHPAEKRFGKRYSKFGK